MSKYQPYGNVKMKGKLNTLLPCKCCNAINKKKINKSMVTKQKILLDIVNNTE